LQIAPNFRKSNLFDSREHRTGGAIKTRAWLGNVMGTLKLGNLERRRKRQGSAIVEVTLMMPWLAFLFVGILDFGFYSYAAICTQNAARAAAIATASSSSAQTFSNACRAALGALTGLPNMGGISTCETSKATITLPTRHPPLLQCSTATQLRSVPTALWRPVALCRHQRFPHPRRSQLRIRHCP